MKLVKITMNLVDMPHEGVHDEHERFESGQDELQYFESSQNQYER